MRRHTRNDVASIHGVLVLDEAEAIHELDLGDLAGAMAGKVSLDVGLGSFEREWSVSINVSSTWVACEKAAWVSGRRKTLRRAAGRPGPAGDDPVP